MLNVQGKIKNFGVGGEVEKIAPIEEINEFLLLNENFIQDSITVTYFARIVLGTRQF